MACHELSRVHCRRFARCPDSCIDESEWLHDIEESLAKASRSTFRKHKDPRQYCQFLPTVSFFLLSDRSTAEKYLLQAQKLEPDNEQWAERLGHLYQLSLIGANAGERQNNAEKALVQFELAMSQNKTPQKESSLLVNLAKAAFEAGETEKAKTYADQLLMTANNGAQDWNSRNVVHTGNIILGRLALAAGDIDAAKSYLLEAGKIAGSPQLNSFGPNMQLAKELLETGEKDVVLEYFELCGKFWKNNKLAHWTASVKGGGIPEFGLSFGL